MSGEALLEQVKGRMRETFQLFESKDHANEDDERASHTNLRADGLNPTQAQLRDLVAEVDS